MLKKPCNNCPFKLDSDFAVSGLLRAQEIADALEQDQSFDCHETTRETGCGKPEHCYGAMKVLLAQGNVNQIMRVMCRLGMLDLDEVEAETTPCFDDLESWVDAMLEPVGNEI